MKVEKDIYGLRNKGSLYDDMLYTAVLNLRDSASAENINSFAKVIKEYVDESRPIHMAGKMDERGFAHLVIETRGERFMAMYSRPDEVRKESAVSNINTFFYEVFHNQDIDGINIDPDTNSICVEKRSLLECILYGRYHEGTHEWIGEKNWGFGYPDHTGDDIMTREELQNFAMGTVINLDLSSRKEYRLVSGSDNPGVIPSLIYERYGGYVFILTKSYAYTGEPKLTEAERKAMLSIGKQYNGKCYWAPVGFIAADPVRSMSRLLLKGDAYYRNYKGLRPIK